MAIDGCPVRGSLDDAPYHGVLETSFPTVPPEPFPLRDWQFAEFASTIWQSPQEVARCYHALAVVLGLLLVLNDGIICLAIPLMVAALVATTS